MAEEVVASFAGPLNSFGINLSVTNASTLEVRSFGISGHTAKFPVVWDSVGVISGPATVLGTNGTDTEHFLTRFSGFAPGEAVKYTGIDPDFAGDTSSGVRVLDLTGCRAIVMFSNGTTGFGEFHPTDKGTLQAIISRP